MKKEIKKIIDFVFTCIGIAFITCVVVGFIGFIWLILWILEELKII